MHRRDFFRASIDRVAKTVVQIADEHVNERARHWIRPPYALTELEFLLACTRCEKCVDACPHNVIFKLSAKLGAKLVETPALDLLNKACHMCEDWPCVQSCDAQALALPEPEEDEQIAPPKLAIAAINEEACLPYHGPECGVCASACPLPDAMHWFMERPTINTMACTGCGLCREACILEPKAINIYSLHSE